MLSWTHFTPLPPTPQYSGKKGLTHLGELNTSHNIELYIVCLVDWARAFSTQQL